MLPHKLFVLFAQRLLLLRATLRLYPKSLFNGLHLLRRLLGSRRPALYRKLGRVHACQVCIPKERMSDRAREREREKVSAATALLETARQPSAAIALYRELRRAHACR